ncbi:MAG: SAM-dependent methyltransferase [Henriciella sp.]|nr:SAM-dependent methyltransferase [Henriciella sp.]
MQIELEPIGYVRDGRSEVQDDHWGSERCRIELTDAYGPEALFGLSDFSHLEIIFYFDRVPDTKVQTGARHPRNNKDWPLVGIFGQRGKNRPNRLGLCTCKLISVEGTTLTVEGLDAIEGTPVLDIKPLMRGFQPREDTRQPEWAGELMKNYW